MKHTDSCSSTRTICIFFHYSACIVKDIQSVFTSVITAVCNSRSVSVSLTYKAYSNALGWGLVVNDCENVQIHTVIYTYIYKLFTLSKHIFVLTAKGAIQKEMVYFGLWKQEAVIFQRPVGELLCVDVMMFLQCRDPFYVYTFKCFQYFNIGCRGIRGHFHRHREQRLLCERVRTEARTGKQMEVRHYGRDTRTTFCLHVRAGEWAKSVAAGPQRGPTPTHDTTGLYQ